MQSKDTFSGYHPLINFLYFALVLIFSMVFMHPVCLLISLASAVLYLVSLNGQKGRRFTVVWMLPVFLLAAISGPLFSHQGNTILWKFPTGSPLTLESILYGIAAAIMLIAVIIWFFAYSEIMTTDKFMYLFGRIIPGLALVVSMTLRFIPNFKSQMQTVSDARKALGGNSENETFIKRIKGTVTILSVMITWSLENAIETADSMNARGYGLKGRTAFSVYRFDSRDIKALVYLIAAGALVITGWIGGYYAFSYFPALEAKAFTPVSVIFYLIYGVFCLTPVIIDKADEQRWKRLRSEI